MAGIISVPAAGGPLDMVGPSDVDGPSNAIASYVFIVCWSYTKDVI